jgi:anti-sigma factor ChrR (cupin superfamily)
MNTQQTPTQLRADFTQRALVLPGQEPWRPSPSPGVERRMLDRVGGEVARATSLVRYAPGSRFSEHRHDLGEEFLVLAGTFCDEHGVYPTGTYVRNPPGSSHAPYTEEGCTIFVKLRQFDPQDQERVVLHLQDHDFSGAPRLLLHHHGPERVCLEERRPGFDQDRDYPGGAELLVLSGDLCDEEGYYRAGSWLRLPPGTRHELASPSGCVFYCKTGHLG